MLSLVEAIHKAGDPRSWAIYVHVLEEVGKHVGAKLLLVDVSVPSQSQACCHSLGFSLRYDTVQYTPCPPNRSKI